MIFPSLRKLIADQTSQLLKAKGKDIPMPAFDLSIPPPRVPGDLASNVTLMIAKQVGASPRQLAEEMIQAFPKNKLTEKIEIAGAGFLNFWLTQDALSGELESLLSGSNQGRTSNENGPAILLEFVSANPTGPLHVGHGRGAALGDSLARILRYVGCRVSTEFYVNDAGGQIRNLGLSIEARLNELQNKPFTLPEGGYHGGYVKTIAEEILKERLDLHPVKSDQMIFDKTDMSGYASGKLRVVIEKTLGDFGVTFDRWYCESELHRAGTVNKLLSVLKDQGLAYENEGAIWFKATDYGDEKDRVLKKGNEAPTYFASDIAYHMDKFNRGFDRFINIWGADHHGYAQRLKGALKALGKNDDALTIIFNQMISVKGGKMSKRAGNVVTLQEVVDEVGRDATRFFFALRSPGAHFEFDLDLAKKQASDNPVFYVQYVHARCCSIFRECEKKGWGLDMKSLAAPSGKFQGAAAEKDVILHLATFPAVVEACAKDFSNHHLTVYLQELAGKFHSFYETSHVLVDDVAVRNFRLGIVDAIRKRVAEGLDLLGVSAPESL